MVATPERARQIEATLRRIETDLGMVLRELRHTCTHEYVVEAEYISQTFFPSIAPRRMCLNCGIEEAGWRAGYQVLTAEPVHFFADRDDFYAARPYPDNSEEWAWCHGDGGHPAPKEQIGHHLRCGLHS